MRKPGGRNHEARSMIKEKLHVRFLSLFLISFLTSYILPLTSASSETVEKIVAVVGSEIITLYDLDSAMAAYLSEIKNAPNRDAKYKNLKSEVLEKLIDDRLLKQALESSKIEVTAEDVSRQIRAILAQNHASLDLLKSELAKKGVSYESYREDIKASIQRYKFMSQEIGPRIKVSEQDMKDYYSKHMDDFGAQKSVHIAQIVLPFGEGVNKEKAAQLKAKAEEIAASARSGTSFASLAKQYSKGPNAETGGDLGIVDPANLLPEIAAAVEKMKVGQISGAIVSPAGVHVIHLIDRGKATEADFGKMKDKIYNTLYDYKMQEELNQYLSDQRKKTYIDVRN